MVKKHLIPETNVSWPYNYLSHHGSRTRTFNPIMAFACHAICHRISKTLCNTSDTYLYMTHFGKNLTSNYKLSNL